jgi:hypothetical protein
MHEVCRRRCEDCEGYQDPCVPQMAGKGKQEIRKPVALRQARYGAKEVPMPPSKRYVKPQAKARQRRGLKAQERLKRDLRQARRVAEALEQALDDLGFPSELSNRL